MADSLLQAIHRYGTRARREYRLLGREMAREMAGTPLGPARNVLVSRLAQVDQLRALAGELAKRAASDREELVGILVLLTLLIGHAHEGRTLYP